MAIIINTTINNDQVSVKSNLKDGFLEATKFANTLISVSNMALIVSISEMTDVEYNPHNGLIRPTQANS